MKEYLDEVKSELRRIDHLLYVTLKYTRTTDIIKSIIDRIVAAFDFGFLALLEYSRKHKKISEIPPQPRKRTDVLKALYGEDLQLSEYITLYLFLRDLSQAKYTGRGDYRKNVTMMVQLIPGETVEINIEKLHEYYDKIKLFLEYLKAKDI